VIAALAHNLARWSTLIGLPNRPVQTTAARRRQLLRIPGRLVRTARRWTLLLPARWPWQTDFLTSWTRSALYLSAPDRGQNDQPVVLKRREQRHIKRF
jgi:hypothetical protein